MILFSLVIAYLSICLIVELVKTQDHKQKVQDEKDRQRKELRDALGQAARMR